MDSLSHCDSVYGHAGHTQDNITTTRYAPCSYSQSILAHASQNPCQLERTYLSQTGSCILRSYHDVEQQQSPPLSSDSSRWAWQLEQFQSHQAMQRVPLVGTVGHPHLWVPDLDLNGHTAGSRSVRAAAAVLLQLQHDLDSQFCAPTLRQPTCVRCC